MRSTLRYAIALLISGCHGAIRPDVGAAEQEVLAAEHEWVKVAIAGDADAFASFLADEYVEMNPKGHFLDKRTWTDRIRSGTSRYTAVEIHDLKVRFPTADVAVVTGSFSQTAVSQGRDNSATGVYVDTWTRIGGHWRLVSSGFAAAGPARQ